MLCNKPQPVLTYRLLTPKMSHRPTRHQV